ncbi:MAG: tetratricopeptide repeat protein [Xanthomonadales bacterium]|nr:tetratricopeptide repeat protein [Xanthomonadales bacterium]
MSLLAELRRRNVFRMAGLYLVGAWLIVQVAETLLPAFDIPGWVLRAIIVLLAIGFVPALVLSWIFELTPEGLRREAPMAEAPAKSGVVAQRMNRTIMVLLVIAVVYFSVDKFVLRQDVLPETPSESGPEDTSSAQASPMKQPATDTSPSIAVLPFLDMSQAKDQEYFSDGLSEELLNLLAQIPQLRVIARTSSFSFKGKDVDIATIAETLGVSHVLEGSVRKAGNTLRITVQLIRASDSSHLWSETFDRDLADIFAVQDEIAERVVTALKLKLLPSQQLTAERTGNLEAYNTYLLGRQYLAQGSPEGLDRAVESLQRVVSLDPNYVQGWIALGFAEAYRADLRADEAGRARASAAAERALKLSPDHPTALSLRGFMRLAFQRDWAGAEADLRRALEQESNDAQARFYYGWLLAVRGQIAQALQQADLGVAIDPLDVVGGVMQGTFLVALGRQDEGIAVLKRRMELNPGSVFLGVSLARALVLVGRPKEALDVGGEGTPEISLYARAMAQHSLGDDAASRAALERLQRDFGSGLAYQIAQVHAWRGEPDEAFDWLERAYTQNDGGLSMVGYDTMLDPLRNDPRFAALVKKLGLAE